MAEDGKQESGNVTVIPAKIIARPRNIPQPPLTGPVVERAAARLQKEPRVLIPGTKTLLAGPPGSGKTTALVTFLLAGEMLGLNLQLGVIVTEPNGEEVLIDACKLYGVPVSRLHFRYIAPSPESWDVLSDMGRKISNMSYADLSSMKHGVSKSGYTGFLDLISQSANFYCARCKTTHGAVDDWGPDWMFAVDSLSGVNTMAMELMIGAKPAAHQGEWGVAMNAEEKLIMKWCADLQCFFTLTAHVEREMDETIGKPIITAAALGRKLAPKLPRFFSDYIYAYKEADKFFWSTTNANMDLKTRSLPFKDKLDPSFVSIVKKWQERTMLAHQAQPQEQPGAETDEQPS